MRGLPSIFINASLNDVYYAVAGAAMKAARIDNVPYSTAMHRFNDYAIEMALLIFCLNTQHFVFTGVLSGAKPNFIYQSCATMFI